VLQGFKETKPELVASPLRLLVMRVAPSIDVAVADAYLSLVCFDEVVFSYRKAFTVMKSSQFDSHPSVAAVLSCLCLCIFVLVV
jgi:hypothetical protein